MTGVGRVRTLTYPLHDWGTFYGPIGPNPTATLLAGLPHSPHATRLGHARPSLGRWRRLRPGADERTMELAGLHPHAKPGTLPRGSRSRAWQDYWSGRDKKWRHNIERCGRRLAEQGEVTFQRYRPEGAGRGDGDPRWDLYDACVEIARRSWQSSGGEAPH